jgi:hypothetical protein
MDLARQVLLEGDLASTMNPSFKMANSKALTDQTQDPPREDCCC